MKPKTKKKEGLKFDTEDLERLDTHDKINKSSMEIGHRIMNEFKESCIKRETKLTAIITTTIAFIVLFIVDLFLTLRMGDIGKLLEANLVYPYIGIIGIIIVNLIIIGVFYLLYKRSTNPSSRFYFINLLVTLCVVRLFVILNNIQVILNPPTIEQAIEYSAQATVAVKVAAIETIAWISFVPFFIAVITYLIWEMDHKIEVKEC